MRLRIKVLDAEWAPSPGAALECEVAEGSFLSPRGVSRMTLEVGNEALTRYRGPGFDLHAGGRRRQMSFEAVISSERIEFAVEDLFKPATAAALDPAWLNFLPHTFATIRGFRLFKGSVRLFWPTGRGTIPGIPRLIA